MFNEDYNKDKIYIIILNITAFLRIGNSYMLKAKYYELFNLIKRLFTMFPEYKDDIFELANLLKNVGIPDATDEERMQIYNEIDNFIENIKPLNR